MPDAKKLLAAKGELDREFAEQQELLRQYGNNRAGRRKVAAEMRRRKRSSRPQKAREQGKGR